MPATFQRQARRLLISGSSCRVAPQPWKEDWRSSVSVSLTRQVRLHDAPCRTDPGQWDLEKQGGDGYNLVDWYQDVLRKHKDRLLAITRYVVADAWISKATFVNELCAMGFHLISRLRDDASLWYSHDGIRTGKRGRPRIKGEKIDFDNLDLSRCEPLEVEGGKAFVIKAYAKAMKRNIKSWLIIRIPAGTRFTSLPTLTCREGTLLSFTAQGFKSSSASEKQSSLQDWTIARQGICRNSILLSTHRLLRWTSPKLCVGNTIWGSQSDC